MRILSIVMKNPHPQIQDPKPYSRNPADICEPGEGLEEISWPRAGSLQFLLQNSAGPINFQKLSPHIPILLGSLDFSEALAEGSHCSLECRGAIKVISWKRGRCSLDRWERRRMARECPHWIPLRAKCFFCLLPSLSSLNVSFSPFPIPDLALLGCPWPAPQPHTSSGCPSASLAQNGAQLEYVGCWFLQATE
uniref:uncharacterized protein LOC100413948 n=1 Tax=Callithrix jacchus TaxID=9483 RepID=UPI0023DD14A6|nr:uncharacterized protein LOC100413948 [Callithrix jacchus]